MKITTKVSICLVFAFSISLSIHTVLAKPLPARKLIPMEPHFDTSQMPKLSPFKVNIEHTEIIYPQDDSKILHGESKVVDLSVDQNNNLMRGKVSAEIHESIIKTREYGVKPIFNVDLRKMTAKYAPDLSRLLEDELASGRKKLAAQIARDQPLMEEELRSRKPIPDFPSLPKHGTATVDDAPLKAALADSQLRAKLGSEDAIKKYQAELTDAEKAAEKAKEKKPQGLGIPIPAIDIPKMPNISIPKIGIPQIPKIGMPEIPKIGMPEIPKMSIPQIDVQNIAKVVSAIRKDRPAQLQTKAVPQLPDAPSSPTGKPAPKSAQPDTTVPQKLMAEELVNAKLKLPPDASSNLKGELAHAKTQAQLAVRNAQPAMNAVLTNLHTVGDLKLPSGAEPELAVEGDASSIIKWDEWHADFAKLANKPILSEVNKAGNPQGTNTVEITVRSNHQLSVRLAKPGNEVFDQAILNAYRSLDGNPSLQYPAGSRRSAITFFIDNQHEEEGAPSSVKNKTSVGDQEILRFHH